MIAWALALSLLPGDCHRYSQTTNQHFWLPASWALRLPWWPPAECCNVSMLCAFLIFTKCFLFLYHYCILSEKSLLLFTNIHIQINIFTSERFTDDRIVIYCLENNISLQILSLCQGLSSFYIVFSVTNYSHEFLSVLMHLQFHGLIEMSLNFATEKNLMDVTRIRLYIKPGTLVSPPCQLRSFICVFLYNFASNYKHMLCTCTSL